MKAIVTGAAGFIGSNLVDELIDQDFEVIGLDNLTAGIEKNVNPRSEFHKGDIRDYELLRELSSGCDYFFHMAAEMPIVRPPFEDTATHDEVNVIGTIRCVEAAASAGVRKFLYASTTAVYGQAKRLPITEEAPVDLLSRPYSIQKFSGEQHALLLGKRLKLDVVSLRLFANYGPRSVNREKGSNAYSPVIGIFLDQKIRGVPLTITGDGSQTRDFVYVKDTAKIFTQVALDSRIKNDVFNVCTGKGISIQDLANIISPEQTYIPLTYGEVEHICGDNKKLASLGIKPQTSLEEGIEALEIVLRGSP